MFRINTTICIFSLYSPTNHTWRCLRFHVGNPYKVSFYAFTFIANRFVSFFFVPSQKYINLKDEHLLSFVTNTIILIRSVCSFTGFSAFTPSNSYFLFYFFYFCNLFENKNILSLLFEPNPFWKWILWWEKNYS